MEYYRTKNGERVYISTSKQFASRPNDIPDEMVYRVRDGHALWGDTRADLITEKQYLKLKNKKTNAKH